jgi:predicted DsbA family dithiol-disulfide isomerase
MGITSVPTFIIDDKYMISGGQPVETFVDMLNKIVAEEALLNK